MTDEPKSIYKFPFGKGRYKELSADEIKQVNENKLKADEYFSKLAEVDSKCLESDIFKEYKKMFFELERVINQIRIDFPVKDCTEYAFFSSYCDAQLKILYQMIVIPEEMKDKAEAGDKKI